MESESWVKVTSPDWSGKDESVDKGMTTGEIVDTEERATDKGDESRYLK